MLIKPGEKLFVVTRRKFERDLRRHFVGEVESCADHAVRVKGYVFVFDDSNSDFIKREDMRTRIFSITDAGLIINIIPAEVKLNRIRFTIDERNQRVITDGETFRMNVSEFTARL